MVIVVSKQALKQAKRDKIEHIEVVGKYAATLYKKHLAIIFLWYFCGVYILYLLAYSFWFNPIRLIDFLMKGVHFLQLTAVEGLIMSLCSVLGVFSLLDAHRRYRVVYISQHSSLYKRVVN